MQDQDTTYTAFEGKRMVASGTKLDVAIALKQTGRDENILVFNDTTGGQVDFDLTGSMEDVVARLCSEPTARRSPGRPRLGVLAREVTLLPRHWEWLNEQPGGASATLRRLVDTARKAESSGKKKRRQAQAAADRFMMAVLGDHPGYEEAARALYAGDKERFQALVEQWPTDLAAHARRLAAPAFDGVTHDTTVPTSER